MVWWKKKNNLHNSPIVALRINLDYFSAELLVKGKKLAKNYATSRSPKFQDSVIQICTSDEFALKNKDGTIQPFFKVIRDAPDCEICFFGFENYIESYIKKYKQAETIDEKSEWGFKIKTLSNQIKFNEDLNQIILILSRDNFFLKEDNKIDALELAMMGHNHAILMMNLIIEEIEIDRFAHNDLEHKILISYLKSEITEAVSDVDLIKKAMTSDYNKKTNFLTENSFLNYKWILREFGFDNIHYLQFPSFISKVRRDIDLDVFENQLINGIKENDKKIKFCLADFSKMDGFEFEKYIADYYRNLGYDVFQTPKSGDQGADILIKKENEITVIQAKNYSSKVTNSAIQQVVASMKYYSADKAMVITNNFFTNSAVELAEANGVELIDGDLLRKLIENSGLDLGEEDLFE